jgi:hypothetical protein
MGLSTGYTGIAWAETVSRPRPMANVEAASNLMDVPFPLICRDAADLGLRNQHGSLIARLGAVSTSMASSFETHRCAMLLQDEVWQTGRAAKPSW